MDIDATTGVLEASENEKGITTMGFVVLEKSKNNFHSHRILLFH